MCGIAGISVGRNDHKMSVETVASELLLGIETRGYDATGAAWYDEVSDTVAVTKVPVIASRFVPARREAFPATTPAMILHTRTGTHGKADDRGNNHPVIHDRIVGVHNGVLRNHKELFELTGRTPKHEVDTEGLMALLNEEEHPTEVLGMIKGDAAIAWIDLEQPEVLHLACVTGRPLYIAQTKQGSLLFASTKSAVHRAAKADGLELVFEEDVETETYMRVTNGIIAECLKIPGVQHSDKAFRAKYAYTSGGDAKKDAAKEPAAPLFSDVKKAPSKGPRVRV